MTQQIDFSKLKTSWTKYDIVRVMESVHSVEALQKFKDRKAGINEPILRSFLGVRSLDEPIPQYWIDIQKFPKEKDLFSLFALILTHGETIETFIKSSHNNMKGIFEIENGKEFTNIRSALVESHAAEPYYRRSRAVPYDFSHIFQNYEVGKLFKNVIEERIRRLSNSSSSTIPDFYDVCFENNLHRAFGVTKHQFKSWLEGEATTEYSYIESVHIIDFFSIRDINIDSIKGTKEVYLLGENGDGKSLILMAMYLAFNRHYIIDQTKKEKTGCVTDLLDQVSNMQLTGIDTNQKIYKDKNVGYLQNFFAYGTHRGRYSADDAEEYGFMSLFDRDQKLMNPVSWLKDLRLEELQASNLSKSHSSAFTTDHLSKMFHDLLEKHVTLSINGKGVFFNEKGTNINFEQLSEGYKSIIIFVSDLICRLSANQKEAKAPKDFRGIVLVDEIDLHLHPKWQRVVVKKLRTLFPKIQFIFTTHSPTMIQGASDDAIIYRVYRNSDDGVTKISDPFYRKELSHLMINTLLTSPMFGLDDSRMDSDNDKADTSDDYLAYKIHKKIELTLKEQKREGKEFVSDSELDLLIDSILKKELTK